MFGSGSGSTPEAYIKTQTIRKYIVMCARAHKINAFALMHYAFAVPCTFVVRRKTILIKLNIIISACVLFSFHFYMLMISLCLILH